MEERRKEVDQFDEIEMLLGEIPNATSGNPNSEESVPCDSMNDFKSMPFGDRLSTDRPRPICVNLPKGSVSEGTQNNNGLDDGTVSMNKFQQSPSKRVQPQGASVPDDQPLTSALAELRISSGVQIEAINPPLVTSLPSHDILPDGEHPNGSNNFPSKMDRRVVAAPFPQSPSNTFNPFNEFDVKKSSIESSNLSILGLQELRRHQVGHFQPIENVFDTFLFGHGAQGFQLHSNASVPGLEFSAIPDHPQYSSDLQSAHPYWHSQQLNQSHISRRHMEEEQYYRMQQHYMYLEQLCNQRLEALHPIQANGNSARLLSRTPRQFCFEMHQQLEQYNQEPRSNNFAPMGFNRYYPAFSSTGFNSNQVVDKLGKPHIPEKILTRSHGLNSTRDVKFGSLGGTESLHQNGKVLPNGHFQSKNAGCFYYDSLSWQGSSLDITDVKSTSPKPHPQRYNSLDEFSGRIYFMAKDQHGCRFLQRKISRGNPYDVGRIFIEIIDHIVELMTDPFGNYLIQKLLEVGDEYQQTQILVVITRKDVDLVRISCDMHGTRAVQKVVETLRTPEQFSMVVSSLKPGIVTLMKNVNGNHVAQRCLQYLVPEHREFLFEAATNHCVELATDRHGCCVLLKCLSHSDEKQRRCLVYEIASNALILSQDSFGNYVVQCIFDLGLPWATLDILDKLDGNYWDLSIQKFSSNVVEKCLKYADEDGRLRIVQELMNNPGLDQIMQDPYGNYVIQAALSHSKGELYDALVEAITPHVPLLRTSPYGKKVLSRNKLKK